MDPASARVALTLQFNDVEEILKTSGNASEARAFTVLRTELVKKLQEVDGQCAAIDTLREENVKKATFMRLVAEERQAINDHETACRLAGVTVPPRPNVGAVAERAADDIAHALNGSIKKPKNVELGESQVSPQAATPPPPSLKRPAPDETADRGPKRVKILLPATIPCRSSLKRPAFGDPASLRDKTADDGPKRVKFADEPEQKVTDKVSIGTPAAKPDEPANPNSSFFRSGVATHACRECLEGLFESSITDPTLLPPRCCSKLIPLFSCTSFLPHEIFARFVEKRDELNTPNRTYCSNTGCGKWIKPRNITAEVATCPTCSQKICATCKQKQHDGLCPEDQDVKNLMGVAREKRWQVCPQCKEMVELGHECYHITCRCHHEFCYSCLAKWKTCKCDTWYEKNIMDRDAQAVNVAPVANPPIGGQVGDDRRQRGHRNRNRNRGHKHGFKRLYAHHGADTTCFQCGHDMQFIQHCSDCGFQSCIRCLNNRD